jgi:glycosyltransferase involved in cell wall biosynthesis
MGEGKPVNLTMMLSILVPCKNEPDIAMFIKELETHYPKAQIIVSSDRYGKGKGWALKQALPYAKGKMIALIDGDGDIHPRMLERLLPFIYDYDIVVGRKQIRGFLSRRLLTRISRLYIWLMFGLLYDTQTGIKLFRDYAILEWESNSFAFDIEVLSDAASCGLSIIEVPVEAMSSKRMRISSIWKCLCESIRIWRNKWKRRERKLKQYQKKSDSSENERSI